MAQEFNLMVAPNGARLLQSDHPALPITPDELAQTAKECFELGANSIHLHVRDDQGKHSLDPERYALAANAVRTAVPEMMIQISTEAVEIFDVPSQIHCIEMLRPEAVSISVREIAREPALIKHAYLVARATGAQVEHIVYSPEDIINLLQGFEDGTIPETMRNILCVLGRYTEGQVSSPRDLDPFLEAMKGAGLSFSTCAFGQNEQDCLLYSLQNGGNARIGFENNRLTPDGNTLRDNAHSVESFVNAAAKAGFAPRRSKP